jgi:hypothetical protein
VTYVPPTNVDNYWDWELPPPAQHFQGDYFFFHHTEGDNMVVLDTEQMDRASAVVAVHAYAQASLKNKLPRGETVLLARGESVIKCSSPLNVLKYTYDHSCY